jgi:hypothetical protein
VCANESKLNLRRGLLAVSLLVSCAATTANGVDPEVKLSAHIGPRPVTQALAAFGRQTGLQLIYISTIAGSQQSKGARAGQTASDALAQLLEDTGLAFEFLNARTVRIFPAPTRLYRQIEFDREPLERVAAEFNRYAAKPFEIVTPALRNLRISGAFAADDSTAFIAFLSSLEGVRVEVTATRIRVSQTQPAEPRTAR